MRWFKAFWLLCVHPYVLLLAFVSVDTYANFSGESLSMLALRCCAATKRALMYSVVDSLIYGNWVFPAACTSLLPVWMLLWHVLFSKPTPQHHEEKLKTT